MEQDWKQIVISDFSGGLSRKYWTSNTELRVGKNGEHTSGSINPLIFPGYLSIGSRTHTDITNVGSLNNVRVCRFISVDDNVIDTTSGTSIYAGNGSKLQAINPTSNTIQNAGSWPHTIAPGAGTHSAHSTFSIDDVVEYQLNGTRKVFYFYRDNTDGDAGTWDGSSFDANEDVFSGATGGFVLNKTYPIIPIVADNSFMYVANGSSVHKFDGTTDGGASGTVTADVLKYSSSRTIVDMADGKGKLWIATRPAYATSTPQTLLTGPARDISITIWNRSSTIVAVEDSIPMGDCSEIYNVFFHRGECYAFTLGANKITQLRKYNGTRFVVVCEVGQAGVGRPANRGAIQTFYNGILWQDVDGKKFWYGTITDQLSNYFTSNDEDKLHIIGRQDTISSGSAGAIFRKGATTFYDDYVESGSEKITTWDPLDATALCAGIRVSFPYIELPQNSIIHGIKILFADFTPAGGQTGTIQLNVFKDINAGPVASFDLNIVTDGPKGYLWMPLKLRDTNRISFYYDPSTALQIQNFPRLYRIEVYYTPARKTL